MSRVILNSVKFYFLYFCAGTNFTKLVACMEVVGSATLLSEVACCVEYRGGRMEGEVLADNGKWALS
jgi:hypothetical protein